MARNTRTQLEEALKRLMEKKSPDRITVQELADEANVNKTLTPLFKPITIRI